jgi:uncharacterized protein
MENTKIRLGESIESWQGNISDKKVRNVTFSVTEDCNLACKYCYMTGKNNNNKMSYETAKKCVDYIISNRNEFNEGSVVFDFIGGEPFLEIDLIDRVCDYIKLQMFTLDHPWFDSYRFSFSTNGLLYNTEKVQKFINKNRGHLSIGISVDGNKIKHDMQRVYPDGSGSYDDVMRNVRLWQTQFKDGFTKATFAHDDLKYLKESVVSLWDNGIKDVAANVVFENVWQEGDDIILEQQLDELGNYILKNEIWDSHYVRFFDASIGNPIKEHDMNHNFCGAGQMLAINCDGEFFPCIRFLDFSLQNRKGRCIGSVDRGINKDKLRAFQSLTLKNQSKSECINCEVASGCALCTGFNYDDSGTIFERATYICKLHKATVRANKRFWAKYEKVTGKDSPRKLYENLDDKKYIQIMLSDDITPHCSYRNWKNTDNVASEELVEKAIDFAEKNNFEPVLLGSAEEVKSKKLKDYISLTNSSISSANNKSILIYDNNADSINEKSDTCIVLVKIENIENITGWVKKISTASNRINIVLENIEAWNTDATERYEKQLENLVDFIEGTYEQSNPVEINILTDRIYFDSHSSCTAGTKTFTLAPNGKFYICPAFYFENPDNSIGSLNEGIKNEYGSLMEVENAPICNNCDAYQCKVCKYLNKKLTDEYNVPSKVQCIISHVERNKSKELQQRLISRGFISNENIIKAINYLDPLDNILMQRK